MPRVIVDGVSSQVIGEPDTGVWCSTCQAGTAIVASLALLVLDLGGDVTVGDPVAKLATVWYCEGCGGYFELPDSPTLKDNRDG